MPDKWMNKFFVRYYYTGPKIYPGRAIGICTWLYDVEEGMMLFEVPYVSCSYVEYDRQHKDIDKEWFRRMGQYEGYSLKPDRNKSGIYTYEGSLDDRTEFTKMISYFLELTKLETDEKIDDYVITPLVNLFKGEGTVENIPVKELLILKE